MLIASFIFVATNDAPLDLCARLDVLDPDCLFWTHDLDHRLQP